MENESSNEEPLINENEKPSKNTANKDKGTYVLKQLDNNNLHPIQERVGIYVIAIFSTLGLILIGYTGVMAITSNAPDTTAEAPVVDADEVHHMLSDIDLEDPTETDELPGDDDFESDHEYVEQFEPGHEYVEPEEDEPEPDDAVTSVPTTATVNIDLVGLRREPNSADVMGLLHEDDVVTIVDIAYNAYWVRVYHDGLEGYVAREFIETD